MNTSKLKDLREAVNKLEMTPGQIHEPFAIFVEHVGDMWRGTAIWPGNTASTCRESVGEVREWALKQSHYAPTMTDIRGENNQWSCE